MFAVHINAYFYEIFMGERQALSIILISLKLLIVYVCGTH